MIAHAWTVVAEKSIIDRDTNNISLDVLEKLAFVGAIPAGAPGVLLPYRVEVVSLWYRQDPAAAARTEARVRLLGPDGAQLSETILDLDLTVFVRLRTRFVSQAIPVIGPGVYLYDVAIKEGSDWRTVADVPLEIMLEAPAPAPAPA